MNMTTLQQGRPADAAARTPAEARCYDLLDKLAIEYGRVDHDEAATIEACLAVETVLGTEICKNLFLCNRQKTRFYLLTMAPNKPFFTKELGKQINSSRLSFAPEEFLQEYLQCSPGSATALGLMHDVNHQVQLVIDKEVYEAEFFCCHPCICTSTVKLKTADLLEKFLPHTGHSPILVNLPEYST